MVSAMRTALIIFGLTLFITSGSALRCWVCASNVNSMCKDPMNTSDHNAAFHIRTCDPGPYGSSKPICRKIVKREMGERVVIRQCSTPYHDEMDTIDGQCGNSVTQAGRDVIESCHICSSDLCNSATAVSATRLIYIAVIILSALTFHQSKYVL
ncbi:uncharacterized protein LOC105194283 [Solenopsis invicta]|uniref:uncharacterized protein LOC105194283 n=1 Tax=Solenopsis invicta TaxID=13686 RepID=UPI000595B71D|nr:uncharacterized protein LOC105194283 [Solenopsis invicta]